jgi:tetratricopeptide (TPR) repeat protein
MSTNEVEKLFESFSLKPGQKNLAPSDEKKLADSFQRQLNLDFDVCAAIARQFASVKISKLNDNAENSRVQQVRNDADSQPGQIPRPKSLLGAAAAPPKSPLSRMFVRSRSPLRSNRSPRPRSKSPISLFGRNQGANKSQYSKMDNEEKEGSHDVMSHTNSLGVDPMATIEPAFAEFSIGSSPSKKLSRSTRRKSTNHKNTVPTPGPQDMSYSFFCSPPTPDATFTQPTVVQEASPASLIQQEQQQQQQQQIKQERKKIKAKRPNQLPVNRVPAPFVSPIAPVPTDARFGSDSDTSRRQTAPPNMASAAEATRLIFSPKSPIVAPCASTDGEARPSVPQTCVSKKPRDTEFSILSETTEFNLGTLKPEAKKIIGQRRVFRQGKHGQGVDICQSKTEDTGSITDNSPSNSSDGNMSWVEIASPPPRQVTAPVLGVDANNQCSVPQQQPAFLAQAVPEFQPKQPLSASVPNGPVDAQEFHIGVGAGRGAHRNGLRNGARRKQNFVRQANSQSMQRQIDRDATVAKLTSLRFEGKSFYRSGDYRNCVIACTNGIEMFHKKLMGEKDTHLLAVFYSNRAAALLMLGGYQAAADDCTDALQYCPKPTDPTHSSNCHLPMIPKLHNRRARANCKLGKLDSADKDFDNAIDSADRIRSFLEDSGGTGIPQSLQQETIEATNGKIEIIQCRRSMDKLKGLILESMSQTQATDALEDVNTVLSFCSGSSNLLSLKVRLFSILKRWRELIRFCERFAAEQVKLDGCFPGALILKDPFPGVPPATHLKSTAFDGVSDNHVEGVTYKLSVKATGDVVLRLPHDSSRHFVRALRLMEDYASARHCITCLRDLVQRKSDLGFAFNWLAEEERLVTTTQDNRGLADHMFAEGRFQDAADQYHFVACLDHDAGGRLHAVMHCNRAACFMALSVHSQALTECNQALDIHPRYMKALLRRARCHQKLDRYEEAFADYKQYLDYVQQAKSGDNSFIYASQFVFEGPHEVKPETLHSVTEERQEVLNLIEMKKRMDEQRRRFAQQQREGSNARRRREQFYQSSERPWDSFRSRGPGSGRSPNAPRRDNDAYSGNRTDRITMNQASDHYAILKLSRDATEVDIKKAYRSLARVFHPDKRPDDPDASENFRLIQEAYETLNDPAARRKYDRERLYF